MGMTNDLFSMECAVWQEAIGAMLDGERPEIDAQLVEAHVRRCPECASFEAFAHGLRRAEIRPASPQPDLAPAVVKTAQILDGVHTWTVARAVLAVCAIEIIAFSLPDLLVNSGDSVHSARHLGAFTAAFGAALMVVVFRPARARAMLPVALVLGFALVISAVVDLLRGEIPLVNEVQHIPEVVSVAMLWLLATPSRRHGTTRSAGREVVASGLVGPRLRAVDRRDKPA
jgi:predicted anti-sigma-YlaC factor YlaD